MELPKTQGEGKAGSSDLGFALGQALSAGLLGGLSIGAKRDYVTPFLENQRRLEGLRAKHVEKVETARLLSQQPGMAKIFTDFGGGDLNVGLDRFAAIDTEVGISILEKQQGAGQFDAYAEAMAAAVEEGDPGAAQALRDLVGRGNTNLDLVNGTLGQRQQVKDNMFRKSELETEKASQMFQTLTGMLHEGLRLDKIMPVVFKQFMGDGGAFETEAGKGMVNMMTEALTGIDGATLKQQTATMLTKPWSEIQGVGAADPQLFAEVLGSLGSSARNRLMAGRLGALAVLEGNPEALSQFLNGGGSAEEVEAFQEWAAAGKPVDPSQMLANKQGDLLDKIEGSLSSFSGDRVTQLAATKAKQEADALRLQNVESSVNAFVANGFLDAGAAKQLMEGLDPAEIGIESTTGKLILPVQHQNKLVALLSDRDLTGPEAVALGAQLDDSFSDDTVAAYVKDVLVPKIDQAKSQTTALEGSLKVLELNPATRTRTALRPVSEQLTRTWETAVRPVALPENLPEYELDPTNMRQGAFSLLKVFMNTGVAPQEELLVLKEAGYASVGLDDRVGLINRDNRKEGYRTLVQEVTRLRDTFYTKETRNKLALRAAELRNKKFAFYEWYDRGTRNNELADIDRTIALLDSGFIVGLSKLGPANRAAQLASMHIVDPGASLFGEGYRGMLSYQLTAADVTPEATEEEGFFVDPTKVDYKGLSLGLDSYNTSLWQSLTPFNSNADFLRGPLLREKAEAEKTVAQMQDTYAGLENLGTLGSIQAKQLGVRINSIDRVLKSAEDLRVLTSGVDSVLQEWSPESFNTPGETFKSILASDGISIAFDGSVYENKFSNADGVQEKAIVILEYMQDRISANPSISGEQRALLGETLMLQRQNISSAVAQLEKDLSALPDSAIKLAWKSTFGEGYEKANLDSLVFATVFRSPYSLSRRED